MCAVQLSRFTLHWRMMSKMSSRQQSRNSNFNCLQTSSPKNNWLHRGTVWQWQACKWKTWHKD